jgi:hypothetical protein
VAREPLVAVVVGYQRTRTVQLGQPIAQDARGHALAARLRRSEAEVFLAQFPQHPQRPAAPEQVERHQQRPAGSGAACGVSGPRSLRFGFRSAT